MTAAGGATAWERMALPLAAAALAVALAAGLRRAVAIELSPAARRGAASWQAHNCAGCHRLGGRGAAYGPALDGVLARRGEEWVARVLTDPAAARTTARRMAAAGLPPAAAADLVAWLAAIELRAQGAR